MSIRLDGDLIRLEGDCHVEDAEALVRLVGPAGARAADLSAVRHLHAAVLQVLVSFRVPIAARPNDPFLDTVVSSSLPTFEIAVGS